MRLRLLFCFSAFLFSCFAAPAFPATLLDRALGLDTVSVFDEHASLGLEHALPAWAWMLIVIGAGVFAGWSYSHLIGSRVMRIVLSGVRAMLVLLIAILLCQPMVVRRDERVEPDSLIMLVDRSASMQVRDMAGFANGGLVSRDAALREAMRRQAAVFEDSGLSANRRIIWLGFDARAYTIDPPGAAEPLAPPDAPATALRTAIEQALQEGAGRPISGLVVFSDGQTPQATGQDLVRRLEQQAVSVFSVPLGSQVMPTELAIARVDAPERAFAKDVVPIGVVIEQLGGQQAVDPQNVTVRLVDAQTGDVIDERKAEGLGGSEVTRLRGRSELPGRVNWRVEVVMDAEAGLDDDELLSDNNQQEVSVELIDRPIRVLYVEGYPRWEYRYLKNLLIREDSIDSSILLLSADRAFAQEGDTPITRPPSTAEEMRPYDVIILGDVPPSYFSQTQLALLRDQVAGQGAGMLWIGGQRDTPTSFAGTRLADLLPMRHPSQVQRLDQALGPVDVRPTPLAAALNVLELRGLNSARDTMTTDRSGLIWPQALPGMEWMQDLGPLKPTAELLAIGQPGHGANTDFEDGTASSALSEPVSAIVRLRYGAGQSIYVATDETWRWRFGRGELYFEQFWIQLVRMLGRDRVQQLGQRARLVLSHKRVAQDQPVVVDLIVDDPALAATELSSVSVEVLNAADSERKVLEQLELRPVADEPGDPTIADAPARRVYRATWRPSVTGSLVLRVVEPSLEGLELAQAVSVTLSDEEWRRPEADHARLTALAEQTGGAVVPLGELDRLAELVPNRARRIPDDQREPIWNSVLALCLLISGLTAEWMLRKAIRLA